MKLKPSLATRPPLIIWYTAVECSEYPNPKSQKSKYYRIFSLFRLSTIWIFTLNPVNAANASVSVVQRQRYTSCPTEKVEGCFRRAFASMTDPNDSVATCADYERLSACFRFINCSEKESAELGAKIFFSMKHIRLPKEFFTAILTRWRVKCSMICDDYNPNECRLSMSIKEQETDQAMLLEMQSLKLQMALLVGAASSQRDVCTNFRKAILKWHIFRTNKCSQGDSNCYCKKEEKQLRNVCSVQCEKLNSANSSLVSRFELLIAWMILMIVRA